MPAETAAAMSSFAVIPWRGLRSLGYAEAQRIQAEQEGSNPLAGIEVVGINDPRVSCSPDSAVIPWRGLRSLGYIRCHSLGLRSLTQ